MGCEPKTAIVADRSQKSAEQFTLRRRVQVPLGLINEKLKPVHGLLLGGDSGRVGEQLALAGGESACVL